MNTTAELMRLTGPTEHARTVVDRVFREYLVWVADQLPTLGVRIEDPAALVERHHAAFLDELPVLLGPRGRLVVAGLGGEVVGTGALKPVHAGTAEIKRMYVRPQARGRGIARAILELLVADARALRYRTVRLETAPFMPVAQALYRSVGFRDVSLFAGAETSMSGLDRHMCFMALDLPLSPQ